MPLRDPLDGSPSGYFSGGSPWCLFGFPAMLDSTHAAIPNSDETCFFHILLVVSTMVVPGVGAVCGLLGRFPFARCPGYLIVASTIFCVFVSGAS